MAGDGRQGRRRAHGARHRPAHPRGARRANVFDPQLDEPLPDGLVITIEPLVAAGGSADRVGRDGWTISTADRSWSAHSEHTIVVRDGAPLVLTA